MFDQEDIDGAIVFICELKYDTHFELGLSIEDEVSYFICGL